MKIAAIDIGGTAIKHCCYDDKNTFSSDTVIETPTNAHLGAKTLMNTVTDIISSMGSFDIIAVSTAGQVDPVKGSIIFATESIPGYTGTQIKKTLTDNFQVPTVVENDVNAVALGEAIYRAGMNYGDFLCLTYGTGIGGAIIINGGIYYGSTFSAGEFGHIVTHAGGLKCGCGNQGCYESYASTKALIRTVKEYSGLDLNGREIFSAIGSNSDVKAAVMSWLNEVMLGLASLINVFNPPCIVMGGGIMNEDYILDYIKQNLGSYIMKSYRNVEIKRALRGNTAGLLGVIHRAKTYCGK